MRRIIKRNNKELVSSPEACWYLNKILKVNCAIYDLLRDMDEKNNKKK